MSVHSATEVEYQPSPIGRLARVVMPVLQRSLPIALYKPIYEASFRAYRRALHLSYSYRLAAALASGSNRQRLKTRLTMRLLPHTMGGYKALENAFDLVSRANDARIPGAIVECGVAQGGTAAMLSMADKATGSLQREKWFFDSYEGLPEPTSADFINGKAGEFIQPLPKGACLGTIEQVSELLFDDLRLERDHIRLIKGWFQDTVPAQRDAIGPIAVLRLDGDWYESTKIPLETFYPLVSPGGFVIIDDYATCFGSRKATDEVRAGLGIEAPLVPDGRGGVWFQKPIIQGER